jgi:O-acetyl-ADP-ribose deacetylase (regulator of RNase III)
MLQHTRGNLVDLAEAGHFNLIVHGCNCFHTMGSGIAREIRLRYPAAYEVDVKQTQFGDRSKIGTFTLMPGKLFSIVNAYTQIGFNGPGKTDDLFEYEGFQRILDTLAEQFPGTRVGFPYIGMGLAGGNRERIIAMLEAFAVRHAETLGTVALVEFGP